MQNNNVVEQVLRHPKYADLVRKRTKVSLIFFGLTLAIYSGFILTMAYLPHVFAEPLGSGWTMSVGLLVGLLVACSAVILIATYVYISNKKFDPLLAEIVRDVQ